MRDLLLIAFVGLSTLIALRRPIYGLLVFIFLGIFNPHSMTWSIAQRLPLSQFVALGTIVGYLFWNEPKKIPRQRESILLLLLWIMFGISTLFAIYPDQALSVFKNVSKIFLVIFLSTSLINSEQRLRWVLRVIALSLGIYGFKCGLFAIVSAGNYMVWGPENSYLFSNNSIGLALSMNVALLVCLLRIESHKWLRWIIKAMFILSYPAVICTFSRGAWLGLALATALIAIKSRYRFLIISAAVIITLTALPVIYQHLPERVVNRYEDLVGYEEESSAQSRLWNWRFAGRVGMALPLHGGGFDYYALEVYDKYFPEFQERWPGKVWSAHSMWFAIFGEHGFPGIFLSIGLIGSCFISLREIRSFGKENSEMSWMVHYADMLKVALSVYLVVGTFLDAAYFDLFYWLVAFIIIIKERVRLSEPVSSPVPVTATG